MDLCGTFRSRNVILALIDEYARWPEVLFFWSNPSALLIADHLRRVFSVHGIPYQIILDDGLQFEKCNKEIKLFCNEIETHLHNVTPKWPQGSCDVERFILTIKKAVQLSPHCSTKGSPLLLMNGTFKNKLPWLEGFLNSSETQATSSKKRC